MCEQVSTCELVRSCIYAAGKEVRDGPGQYELVGIISHVGVKSDQQGGISSLLACDCASQTLPYNAGWLSEPIYAIVSVGQSVVFVELHHAFQGPLMLPTM